MSVCTGYRRDDGTLGHGGWCPVHGTHCLLCGEPEDGHNEAVCAQKMRDWQPTGLLCLLDGDTP